MPSHQTNEQNSPSALEMNGDLEASGSEIQGQKDKSQRVSWLLVTNKHWWAFGHCMLKHTTLAFEKSTETKAFLSFIFLLRALKVLKAKKHFSLLGPSLLSVGVIDMCHSAWLLWMVLLIVLNHVLGPLLERNLPHTWSKGAPLPLKTGQTIQLKQVLPGFLLA